MGKLVFHRCILAGTCSQICMSFFPSPWYGCEEAAAVLHLVVFDKISTFSLARNFLNFLSVILYSQPFLPNCIFICRVL